MGALDAFTDSLARITELTDEELSTLESDVMAAFDAADQSADAASMEELATALDQIRAAIAERTPSTIAPDEINASGATQDPIIKEEAEDMAVQVPGDRAPKVEEERSNVVVASADVQGFGNGETIPDLDSFAGAMAKRINSLRGVRGGDGEQVIVASIHNKRDEDRYLRANDPEGNRDKIEALTSQAAITASGGCCSPLTTKYDLFTIGETARPVRDALAGFNADRGGIRFFTGPKLSDLGAATGIWTCDSDEAYVEATPGTWKVCGVVDCPTEQTAITAAITSCLTFGVMSSRVNPENVAANTQLALVQHARVAESALLAAIKAGSTAVTGPAIKYGAVRDIILTVARVGAFYRDRHRLGKEIPLRAFMPLWVLDVLRSDIIVQPPAGDGRNADLAVSANDMANVFDQWGINVTWTLDGFDPSSNGGGTYGAMVGAVLPEFPSTVQWALYAEGSWLFLDGGDLDLGVVRDSKLVRANDYMQFSETFEGAAKVGGESLWITSPLQVRGGYSPAITIA